MSGTNGKPKGQLKQKEKLPNRTKEEMKAETKEVVMSNIAF